MANVKISLIGALDMLKFKNMASDREKEIQAAPANPIIANFPINENAKALHPDHLDLVVKEIVDHSEAGAKSFVFMREDGKPLPYFRAGQYLSLKLPIGESFVTRPYSISSGPKWALEGMYAVTIKANPTGFAADWMLQNLKKGDKLKTSAPQGDFYFDKYRDCKDVIALAGGNVPRRSPPRTRRGTTAPPPARPDRDADPVSPDPEGRGRHPPSLSPSGVGRWL